MLRKARRELPSRVRLKEGPIGRVTLDQPTIIAHWPLLAGLLMVPLVLRDCDQEPCVYGLGLFGHWHSWSCVLID